MIEAGEQALTAESAKLKAIGTGAKAVRVTGKTAAHSEGTLLLQDLLYQWGVSQFFFNVWQTLGRS